MHHVLQKSAFTTAFQAAVTRSYYVGVPPFFSGDLWHLIMIAIDWSLRFGMHKCRNAGLSGAEVDQILHGIEALLHPFDAGDAPPDPELRRADQDRIDKAPADDLLYRPTAPLPGSPAAPPPPPPPSSSLSPQIFLFDPVSVAQLTRPDPTAAINRVKQVRHGNFDIILTLF